MLLSSLGILFPVAVLGLIAWVVIGLVRRTAEPFTLATATGLYAHVAMIVGATMALIGGATGIKVLLGFLQMGYSYGSPQQFSCPPGTPAEKCSALPPVQVDFLTTQRSQDLVLALTLIILGLSVLAAHFALSRAIRGIPGGQPFWVRRGTLLAFTVLYGLGGLFGGAMALYLLLSYFILSSGRQPFGEAVGTAVVFIPAWVLAALALLRGTRAAAPGTPATAVPTPSPVVRA